MKLDITTDEAFTLIQALESHLHSLDQTAKAFHHDLDDGDAAHIATVEALRDRLRSQRSRAIKGKVIVW